MRVLLITRIFNTKAVFCKAHDAIINVLHLYDTDASNMCAEILIFHRMAAETFP